MKNLLFIAVGMLSLASCKNSGTAESTDETAVDTTASTALVAEPAAPQALCYFFAVGKDSTTLSVNIAADGTVTGAYDWSPWERDGAHGTIAGKKEGDLLKVVYDYVIEGSNQQEEKVFKLTGDQIAEGEGELTEGDTPTSLKLKDPSKLTWKPLTKVLCK